MRADRAERGSKAQRPRSCVFCGAAGLTNEHVWPAWINGVLPEGLRYGISRTETDPDSEETTVIGDPWHGASLELKVKRVCAACNNGWMSRLESRARPLLTPMILGESIETDEEARKLIATWALLRVAMAEFAAANPPTMPEVHRRSLFERQAPPRHGVFIWLAGYQGDDMAGFYRHTPLATHKERGVGFKPGRANAYGVTFGIYKLVFQVFGMTTAPRGGGDLSQGGDLAASSVRIWPRLAGAATLPVRPGIAPGRLESFGNLFARSAE